jgi:hypothetical protein
VDHAENTFGFRAQVDQAAGHFPVHRFFFNLNKDQRCRAVQVADL